MDESKKHIRHNPINESSFLSRFFFWWMTPFFKLGYKRTLEVADMYNVAPGDLSDVLCARLEAEWSKQLSKQADGGKPSLFLALIHAFGKRYAALGIVSFLEESTKVAQPLLLGGLIRHFTLDSDTSRTHAYLYAGGVSLCSILLAILHHPYFFNVQRIGMQIRIACCSLLYKKALRISNKALSETTVGQIVNLLSNDVNRFDLAVIFLHFLWIGPLLAIAVLVILWHELGPASLAGFIILILLIPMQAWIGKLFAKFRLKTAKHTDNRVRLMNEIITGMRVIKLYCWEKPFAEIVREVRSFELCQVLQSAKTRGVIHSILESAPRLIMLMLIAIYTLMGGRVRAAWVFIALPMINSNSYILFRCIPLGIQRLAEVLVTIRRLENFLMLEEIETTSPGVCHKNEVTTEGPSVCLTDVTAKWDDNADQNTLEKVSASIAAGKLLVVIGPVGAGKSSLLMSVLGEIPVSSGTIQVTGQIAYASQTPWVFSASVRQNIIFGDKYDENRFNAVVKATALTKDLKSMPHGDGTLIGDRGVSLSGGQRARVSLARALYADADIYLLDDPLSAVDATVGRHIFDQCIMGVLKDKPRVLVTHQLQYITEADEILVLKEGRVLAVGTYRQLAQSGIDFTTLLQPVEEEAENDVIKDEPPLKAAPSMHSLASVGVDFEPDMIQEREEEKLQEGNVTFSIYRRYFMSGINVFGLILLVVIFIVAQIAYVMSDWWLSYWTKEEELHHFNVLLHEKLNFNENNITNVTSIPEINVPRNIAIYTSLTVSVFIFGLMRAFLFFFVAIRASQKLHDKMFDSILRSKISFFDTNPVGRILNRFSKDMGQMDEVLPLSFFDLIQCILQISGCIIVAIVVNPWVFIPVVPIAGALFWIRHFYIKTSRNIKRLEAATRSPVFSHVSSTIQGLWTIRAYGAQEKFISEFDTHQNLHTEAWFLFISGSRWLAVRIDWLGASFITSVVFCSVFASDGLEAGLVGLSLTYAMALMGLFQWTVRQTAEVENQMVSVERVMEYTQLPSEAPLDSQAGHKPPPTWPQRGVISAQGVKLQYSESTPHILKGLNFTINSNEKVGIVGRTGAGKSSLLSALFRLVEPTGCLTIDGINIQSIGLHDLRGKISIIPQDPMLFSGTVRKNLDPFSQYTDPDLWHALSQVQLREAVVELVGGLDWVVSEEGSNFSAGQRQLICLARAILKHAKILVIDEATANVDPRTDSLIQETIRSKFGECTVITIAHRLHTIMDSDRILVLDNGHIVEFDEPYALLQKHDGHFRLMVLQCGDAEYERLENISKEARETRRSKVAHDVSRDYEARNMVDRYDDAALEDDALINGEDLADSERMPLVKDGDVNVNRHSKRKESLELNDVGIKMLDGHIGSGGETSLRNARIDQFEQGDLKSAESSDGNLPLLQELVANGDVALDGKSPSLLDASPAKSEVSDGHNDGRHCEINEFSPIVLAEDCTPGVAIHKLPLSGSVVDDTHL